MSYKAGIIKAKLYSGLADSVKSKEDLQHAGKRVVLPSAFMGGDRYMHQQYPSRSTCKPTWATRSDSTVSS